jgi:hypothetical protein
MGYLKLWIAFRNYKRGVRNYGSMFHNYKRAFKIPEARSVITNGCSELLNHSL